MGRSMRTKSNSAQYGVALLIFGLILTAIFWTIAWSSSIPILSEHSFFPLWIGYILTINGVSEISFNESLLRRMGSSFFLLFLISSPFWWFFESINLIVQNWHYIFPHPISDLDFDIEASINFSTVLPAVLSTAFLCTRFLQHFNAIPKFKPITIQRRWLGLSVLLGGTSLCLLPVIPHIAFPLVWIAPTLIIEPICYSLRYPSMLHRIEQGNWVLPISVMMGTLLNGFFWELWNVYSAPRWIYTIPYLGFWKIFEMPVLGYLGYPFFGLIVYSYAVFVVSTVFGKETAAELIYNPTTDNAT